MFDLSPPARAAWMALRAADITVEVKILDSLAKEHHSDWFVKVRYGFISDGLIITSHSFM